MCRKQIDQFNGINTLQTAVNFIPFTIFNGYFDNLFILCLFPQRGCCSVGNKLSFVYNQDSVSVGFNLCQDMGAEDHGFFAADLPDQIAYLDNLVRIKA